MKILVVLGVFSLFASCLEQYQTQHAELCQPLEGLGFSARLRMYFPRKSLRKSYNRSVALLSQVQENNLRGENLDFVRRVTVETGIHRQVLMDLIKFEDERENLCRDGNMLRFSRLKERIIEIARDYVSQPYLLAEAAPAVDDIPAIDADEDLRLAIMLQDEEMARHIENGGEIINPEAYIAIRPRQELVFENGGRLEEGLFEECCICLENRETLGQAGIDSVVQGSCSHIYCETCIREELSNPARLDASGNGKCPLCRKPWIHGIRYQL